MKTTKTTFFARLAVILMLVAGPHLCLLAQQAGHTLRINVTEKATGDAVIMATVELLPTTMVTTTDLDGRATLSNIPEGRYTLRVRYVGMETIEQQLVVNKDLTLQLKMVPSSLALKEVTVTAKVKESGAS